MVEEEKKSFAKINMVIDLKKASISERNTLFGLELFSTILKAEQNSFFSPISIFLALGMTVEGAGGNTLGEFIGSMHLQPDPNVVTKQFGTLIDHVISFSKLCNFSVANSVWVNKDTILEKLFEAKIKNTFKGKLESLDFEKGEEARKVINEWIAKETKEKIKDMIGPEVIKPLTKIILANAVQFKDNWLQKFDAKITKPMDFTTGTNAKVKAQMMTLKRKFNYLEVKKPNFQILELPQTAKNLSMLIMLPESQKDPIELLFKHPFTKLIPQAESEVEVFIPKFKFLTTYQLIPMLQKLGIVEAFSEKKADLTRMSLNQKELVISDVLHNAFIEVNEDGTEASASTVVVAKTKAKIMKPSHITFMADHPFIFIILEKATNNAIFVGHCSNPVA